MLGVLASVSGLILGVALSSAIDMQRPMNPALPFVIEGTVREHDPDSRTITLDADSDITASVTLTYASDARWYRAFFHRVKGVIVRQSFEADVQTAAPGDRIYAIRPQVVDDAIHTEGILTTEFASP